MPAPSPEPRYHNTYNEDDNYFEVRSLAGAVWQSRQDNEIQSIHRNLVKRLGDALFSDGAIISGGGYVLAPGGSSVVFEATEWYFDGIVHSVPAATLSFTTGAEQRFGIKASYSVVTANEDPSLRDPATVPGRNFGKTGANRLRIVAEWVRNDADAVNVYTFDAAGLQQASVTVGVVDPVERTLARRTYNESGNYVVNGFDVDALDKDDTKFYIRVGNRAGLGQQGSVAYIRGVEYIQVVPKLLETSKSLDFATKSDNGLYAPADPDNPSTSELRMPLTKVHGRDLSRVRARFDRKRVINNHQANGVDLIADPNESIVEVLQVYANTPPKTIDNIADADTVYLRSANSAGPGAYYVVGDSINWNVASATPPTWSSVTVYGTGDVVTYLGDTFQAKAANTNQTPSGVSAFWTQVSVNEPSSGGSYYVYYVADRDLVIGTEADLITINGASYVDLSGLTQKPYAKNLVTGQTVSSPFLVDYTFYLARIDVVFMNLALGTQEQQTVEVLVQPGVAAENPSPPQVPGGALPIAQVYVSPGQWPTGTAPSDNVATTQYDVQRVTMLELREALRRLQRAEYNIAVKDLETEAVNRAAASVTGLNGIFTEPFRYTANDLQTQAVKFNELLTTPGVFNVRKRCMTLPLNQTVTKLKTAASPTPAFYSLDQVGTEFPAAYTQSIRTSVVRVNQFDQALDPSEILVGKGNNSNFPVENAASEIGAINGKSASYWAQQFRVDYTSTAVAAANAARPTDSSAPQSAASNNINAFSDVVIQNFFKQEWHWLYGHDFPANALIEVRVDGRAPYIRAQHPTEAWPHVSITEPSSATVKSTGAAADTTTVDGVSCSLPSSFVLTNSSGKFRCAFRIPAGVAAGEVLVTATAVSQEHRLASTTIKAVDAVVRVVDQTPVTIFETLRAVAASNDKVSIAPKVTGIEFYTSDPSVGSPTPLPDNNLSSTGNIWVRVKFEKGSPTVQAGIPQSMNLLVTRSENNQFTLTKNRLTSSAGWNVDQGHVDFSPADVFTKVSDGTTATPLANAVASSLMAVATNGNAISAPTVPADKTSSSGPYAVLKLSNASPAWLQPQIRSLTAVEDPNAPGTLRLTLDYDAGGVGSPKVEFKVVVGGVSTTVTV